MLNSLQIVQSHEIAEEVKKLKDKQELELYKTVRTFTHLFCLLMSHFISLKGQSVRTISY